MGGYQLSVDFGTASTVAVLAGPDGEHHPLLFDGEEFLPSATCLDNAPHLLVGRDALLLGQAHPDRLAAYPKRAVDSGAVVLGGVECPVGDLYAAVFARVAAEARRVAGEPMSAVTLTHPACWDRRRQATLTRAAAKVGLGPTRLVAEPVAAALHVVDSGTLEVADGASVIVYDLGAGTFDAAVVRRAGPTFDVLAQRGLPDAGGLDLDAAVVAHLGNLLADDTIRWERLTRPQSVEDRRAARRLLDDVRAGKELLSVAGSTTILVPLFEESVTLTRADLERIARPLLERTVIATVAAIAEAGVTRAEVAGVLLLGGSSRIPMVARVLREALGVEPTAIRRPKLAVADGCLPVRPRNPARRPRRPEPEAIAKVVAEPAERQAAAPGPSFEPTTLRAPQVAETVTGAAQPRHRPEHPIVELVDVPAAPQSLLDRLRGRRSRSEPTAEAGATPRAASRPPSGAAPHPASGASGAAPAASAAAPAAPAASSGPPTAAASGPRSAAASGATAGASASTGPPAGAAPRQAPAAAQGGWATAAAGARAAKAKAAATTTRDAKVPRSRVARVAKVTAGALAGSLVAVAAGVWVGFAVAPSESFSTIQVGQCVRQDGAQARRVDCTESDAYTVTARVYPAGSCPDPAQPYAMQERTQLCLAPAAATHAPIGPKPAASTPAAPKPAGPTVPTRQFGP